MPSKALTLTADASNQFVLETGHDDAGIAVQIPSGATFGSGTLTLRSEPILGDNDSDFSPVDVDTLIAGASDTYRIGSNMRVYLNLSGATSPDIDVFVSTFK